MKRESRSGDEPIYVSRPKVEREDISRFVSRFLRPYRIWLYLGTSLLILLLLISIVISYYVRDWAAIIGVSLGLLIVIPFTFGFYLIIRTVVMAGWVQMADSTIIKIYPYHIRIKNKKMIHKPVVEIPYSDIMKIKRYDFSFHIGHLLKFSLFTGRGSTVIPSYARKGGKGKGVLLHYNGFNEKSMVLVLAEPIRIVSPSPRFGIVACDEVSILVEDPRRFRRIVAEGGGPSRIKMKDGRVSSRLLR